MSASAFGSAGVIDAIVGDDLMDLRTHEHDVWIVSSGWVEQR